MYRKEITNLIVECWGLGLTAEETRTYIKQRENIMIGLATVYRHRHSITAQIIIDELIRRQLRDIAKEEDSDLRMKYRDKILEKLIPQRIESMGLNVEKIEHVIKWQSQPSNTQSDTLPTLDLTKELQADKKSSTTAKQDSDS